MSKLANKITRFTLYTYIKSGVASIHKETSYFEKVEGLKRRIIDGVKKVPPFL